MSAHDHGLSRRSFLAGALAASAGTAIAGQARGQAASQTSSPKICAFIKFVQDLSYPELAETIHKLGFQGIEATIRKGGYIEPERVADELPKLVAALRDHDVEITVMASDIVRADDPLTTRVLRTAKDVGVTRYRMGFYRYDPKQPVLEQLDALRPVVDDLVALNRELGVQALYQNHSGAKYVGAVHWDFHRLIHDHPVAQLASAFDIRHTHIEAGLAWPVQYNLMRPHIAAIYVKDYDWDGRKARHVPLGTGRVDPKIFQLITAADFDGFYSLHVEYLKTEGTQANIEALRRDVRVLKEWLRRA